MWWRVLVKKLKEGTPGAAAEVDRELTRDLQSQMGRAVSEGIEKRWTGAKAPWNWGYGF
jgi:hypothetical protein